VLVGEIADLHEDEEDHSNDEQEGGKNRKALAVFSVGSQISFRVRRREFRVRVRRGGRGVLRRSYGRGLRMAHGIVNGTAHDEWEKRED